MPFLRLARLAVVAGLSATPTLAEDCRTDGGPLTDLPKAEVTSAKAPFIRAHCAEKPTATGCTMRSYLVKGDVVFLGPVKGKLQCVGYLGRGGAYTEGWLTAAAVQAY